MMQPFLCYLDVSRFGTSLFCATEHEHGLPPPLPALAQNLFNGVRQPVTVFQS
jgi:hypothetical protein